MKTFLLTAVLGVLLLAAWGSWCSSAPVPALETEPKEVATLTGHTDFVGWLAFSPDSKNLVSAGFHDRTVKLWDVARHKHTTTFELAAADLQAPQRPHIDSVVISPDGKTVASGGNGLIQFWDIASGENTATIANSGYAFNLVYSPNGKTLAWGLDNVWLYDIQSKEKHTPFKEIKEQLKTSEEKIFWLTFQPRGKLLLTTISHSTKWWVHKTFSLWDADASKKMVTFEGSNSEINYIAISPDGKVLASVSQDDRVRLWDSATGKNTATFEAHIAEEFVRGPAAPLVFSPDGKLLAAADRPAQGRLKGGSVRVYEVATGKELAQLQGYSNLVSALAFSPDGKLLATGSMDGKIKLWSVPGAWTAEK